MIMHKFRSLVYTIILYTTFVCRNGVFLAPCQASKDRHWTFSQTTTFPSHSRQPNIAKTIRDCRSPIACALACAKHNDEDNFCQIFQYNQATQECDFLASYDVSDKVKDSTGGWSAFEMREGPYLPVNFVTRIPGGLKTGESINVCGIFSETPKRVFVDLEFGETYESTRENIAFHFDIRFDFQEDHNTVVRTHRTRGKFGQHEESIPGFPFNASTEVELTFYAETDRFKVYVDKKPFIDFVYRVKPVERTNLLLIAGDLILKQIHFA